MSDDEREGWAVGYRVDFGKFAGRPLGHIGATDDGLLYLQWFTRRSRNVRPGPATRKVIEARDAIDAYLAIPEVKARLEAAEARPKLGRRRKSP